MDIWIRSQDKCKMVISKGQKIVKSLLIKESIKAKELVFEYDVYSTNGFQKSYLGTYETEERALEILDEIEMYIIGFHDNAVKSCYKMPNE